MKTCAALTRNKSKLPIPEWRSEYRKKQHKFDDIQKEIFLKDYALHGKMALAAAKAGVCLQTVRNHMEKDTEFEKVVGEVQWQVHQRIVKQLETEFIEGYTQPIFSKDGLFLGDKKIMETAGRIAVLKRHDPEYRDRSEVDVKMAGGVLVIPSGVNLDDWISAAGAAAERLLKDVGDGESIEK